MGVVSDERTLLQPKLSPWSPASDCIKGEEGEGVASAWPRCRGFHNVGSSGERMDVKEGTVDEEGSI